MGLEQQEISPAKAVAAAEIEVGEEYLQKLANIVYKSFEYSQGRQEVQKWIFRYLRIIQPNWGLDLLERKQLQELVRERAIRRFRKYNEADDEEVRIKIGPEANHPAFNEKYGRAIDNVVDDLMIVFDEEPKEKEEVITTLLQEIIKRDAYFLLVERMGRPRRKSRKLTHKTDPWLSHVQFYIGTPFQDSESELAEMLADLRTFLRNRLINGEYVFHSGVNLGRAKRIAKRNATRVAKEQKWPEIDVILSAVAKKWQLQHPGEDFFALFDLPPDLAYEKKGWRSKRNARTK